MILSIKNRIILPGIFGANQDSLTEAAIQRSIINMIKITDQEASDISLTTDDRGVLWDAKKGLDREFTFSPEQMMYLRESVYTASKARLITQDIYSVCEILLAP